MKLRRGLGLRTQWWLITILASLLVTVMTFDRTMMRLDNLIYHHLLGLHRSTPPDTILLVEIDERSLRQIGRWPWDRSIHAALIDRLGEAEPQAIAYDVLFTESGHEKQDAQLGRAVAGANPIFFPMLLTTPGLDGAAFEATLPIREVRDLAAGVGYTNLDIDADGVVRSAAPAIDGKERRQHLMELVRLSAKSRPSHQIGAQLIPFAGRAGTWPAVSAASVLAGEVPPELLRGKIILVGATAPGLASQYPVPVGGVMTGLEIEANLLQGLLSNQMIARASLAACLGLALLSLWALMIALGPLHRLPALASVSLTAAAILALCTIALALFRIWLPPGASLMGLLIAYPLWGWRQLAVTQRFMRTELQIFEEEPVFFPEPQKTRIERGAVASTIALLRSAIARNREMRHFIAGGVDQLPDATLITDMLGHVVLVNAAAKRLFEGSAIGQEDSVDAASLLDRFHRTEQREPIRFPPEEGAPPSFEVAMDDGRFFSVRLAEQTSAEGTRVGWIIRFVDISEAKAAQRQREDIVHLLTHDMRSPQASILAILETATLGEIGEEESASIRHYAKRTLDLADGFVQLARAENLEYVIEEVDLRDMLMDAIDDLWPQSKAKSIEIETIEESERLLVPAERSLLTRALVNVIGNAIKYSFERTTISCTLARESRADGSTWARFAITDQGPGLASEQRQKIFERFHRGPMGMGPKVEGVGLGLSFVHTVLVRHGGEIHCDSELGGGATFTLLLPLAS